MSNVPTYADFQHFNPNYFDENGHWRGPTEAQYNALSDAEKFGQFGGVFGVDSGDPRYDALKQIVGGENGRSVYLTDHPMAGDDVYGDRQFDLGAGVYGHSADAQTPHMQAAGEKALWPVFGLPAAFMGAGALSGAFGGAAGAAGDITPGLLSNFSVDTVGADAMADPLAGLAGSAGTAGNFAPVTDLSTGASAGAPVTDLSTRAGLADQFRNLVPGGAMTALRGTAGLAATLAGLNGSKPGSTGSTSGNTSGTPGGNSDVQSLINQMIEANRYDQNTPFGSRHWTQGPDGRWTVNDSMNPGEQQNYDALQGMNLDVTNFAKQRLAALMSQGQHPSAARPITFRGRTIGG